MHTIALRTPPRTYMHISKRTSNSQNVKPARRNIAREDALRRKRSLQYILQQRAARAFYSRWRGESRSRPRR